MRKCLPVGVGVGSVTEASEEEQKSGTKVIDEGNDNNGMAWLQRLPSRTNLT